MRFLSPGFDLSRTLISLLIYMVMFGLFAMIGGIMTTAILSRKKTGLAGRGLRGPESA